MDTFNNLIFPLWGIHLLSDAKTRSISAENPLGEVGGGAREIPDVNNPASLMDMVYVIMSTLYDPPPGKPTLSRVG